MVTGYQPAESSSSNMPSLPPLELGDLSVGPTAGSQPDTLTDPARDPALHPLSAQGGDGTAASSRAAVAEEARDAGPSPLAYTSTPAAAPAMQRMPSEAIGPSTDLPTDQLQAAPAAVQKGPLVQFTLLLASTGTRHPFQINQKYLAKRNVNAQGEDGSFDPASISVYTLKELILKDWRDDWDHKPTSPSAIRLIFFGQMLADNVSLRECKLQTDGASNVLHVTVKPQDVIDEEDAAAATSKHSISRGRRGSESSPGCRCAIM